MEDFVSRKNAENKFRKYILKDHSTFIFYEKVKKLTVGVARYWKISKNEWKRKFRRVVTFEVQ
jgi:hypothetical protein